MAIHAARSRPVVERAAMTARTTDGMVRTTKTMSSTALSDPP